MSAALYIAAKAPLPGLAKTRLSRAIGDEAALALYRAFLYDLAARFDAAGLRPVWYVTPPGAWREIAPALPPAARSAPAVAQGDGDWTARQQALFRLAAERGDERVLLMASDSPQIKSETIRTAERMLDAHEVVLGPVHDGGYWLLGMRGRHDLLAGVTMSTGDVLQQILLRAAALGLSAGLLEPTFDVDEATDLDYLRAAAAVRDDLPATRAALEALTPRWGRNPHPPAREEPSSPGAGGTLIPRPPSPSAREKGRERRAVLASPLPHTGRGGRG